VYGNSAPQTPPSSAGGAGPGSQGSRYTYLVGRLRNRQITMEEATELFALMQTMLARANELARASAMRPSSTVPVAPVPEAPRVAPAASSSDDLLLVGLLAMGAGAGLLAALSKRIAEGPTETSAGAERPRRSATSP
jgi:hypothetical protein